MVVALLFVFVIAVGFKMLNIQFVHGEELEELARSRVYKTFDIPANRGNLYDANGSLLATSVPKFEIRFDAVTPQPEDFDANIHALSEELSKFLGKSPAYHKNRLEHARKSGNRYLFIAKDLGYSDYMKIKSFPLFEKGPYKGGMIAKQSSARELPLGKIAERLVGKGLSGLEGAYNEYLQGKDGHRLKQKIAKGQWKPISDANELEPRDGLDVVSTIDVNIQDIVHHALLRQLETFEADHGTAVLMEVKTGEIKGMANLGRTSDGKYYEKRNYAIWESQEPGSTFKLMAIVAALEDKVVDTSTVFDTENGVIRFYGHEVRDSNRRGYGKISAGRAFELSSNTAFAKMITEGYKNNAKAFVHRLDYMGLNRKLGLEIKGEGEPIIPHPGDSNWYGTTLPWMSFGYGVAMTPLQVLNFYNAIANDGIQVRPRLIKEIRNKERLIKKIDDQPITTSIVSKETAKIAQALMRQAVEKGTAAGLKSDHLLLAGKTGTAQAGYNKAGKLQYTAAFAGFFPADNPEYSCIIVVNSPKNELGFYGGTVAGPAFKEIAEKMYIRTPQNDTIGGLQPQFNDLEDAYNGFLKLAHEDEKVMPNVVGMPVMDALPLLENRGLNIQLKGDGFVRKQSLAAGETPLKNQQITLIAQ